MATLVFSVLGTAVGGPLGGALGSLIGNQFDQTIVGSPKREGPRLKELGVTTSSYGAAIPRHFGQTRSPGTIIWATDLTENKESSGGDKGKPSITSYSYSASFAVALASRPILGIGRIWADGNLLRGAGGDLKVGGALRIYHGHGDQPRDPLIASDRGAACPAFRNLAYCVFENLQLADFGNRIPGLTFEIIADDGEVSLAHMTAGLGRQVDTSVHFPGLQGFSDEGGPVLSSLATLDQVYPLTCDGSRAALRLAQAGERTSDAVPLPEPLMDGEGDSFGRLSGETRRRQSDPSRIPDGLRYYDVARDYQPGLQRAGGRAARRQTNMLEFPGVLPARKAKNLANSAAQRAFWAGDRLMWRIAELDPSLTPGRIVTVPGRAGFWRIETWEWRTGGVELELLQLPPTAAMHSRADPGTILPPADKVATPTLLQAFELPWDGTGSGDVRRIHVAASSVSSGWTGAALYAENDGALTYLAPTGPRRSMIGHLRDALSGSSPQILDRRTHLIIDLVSEEFSLSDTTIRGLANGENRALVGDEILQFMAAKPLGSGEWELTGLLRGRGGTEAAAMRGHNPGAPFVLLNDDNVLIDGSSASISPASRIAAIGLADSDPVITEVANPELGRKPLTPVHPRIDDRRDQGWHIGWTRRARGAWLWTASDTPLNEHHERYLVGVGDSEAPAMSWQTSEPSLQIDAETISWLKAEHSGATLWVRQIGNFGMSDPLQISVIP